MVDSRARELSCGLPKEVDGFCKLFFFFAMRFIYKSFGGVIRVLRPMILSHGEDAKDTKTLYTTFAPCDRSRADSFISYSHLVVDHIDRQKMI